MITYTDIENAMARIAPHIRRTDLTKLDLPGKRSIYIKAENLQRTGAFKVRGAFNCLMQLSDEQKARGVLASSAGNHAQGVALAARTMGIPCTIVMPKAAPISKITATEGYGANVILHGEVYDEAYTHARDVEKITGATFIHPFDDEAVIAGQGTIALEIMEQLPEMKQILVPIGGGGLISGIAVAIKEKAPHVKIIGVEAKNAPSMKLSINNHQIITLATAQTLADGIAVKTVGKYTYDICTKYVDEIITVDDEDTARTILFLLEKGKIVSEGAGAIAVAAALYGKVDVSEPTAAVLSGGNIDVTMISRIIDKGLSHAGRKCVLKTVLSDKPGQLAGLLMLVSATGANVVSIKHDRLRTNAPIGSTTVELELETRDKLHVIEIQDLLISKEYEIIN